MATNILDRMFHFFLGVHEEKLTLKSHPEGVLGKEIEIRFLERRRGRRAAMHAVHEKNDIMREYVKMLRLIKEHDINKVRENAKTFIEILVNGLQETYDASFEEMLVLKADLNESIELAKKLGTNADLDLLKQYEGYMGSIINILNEQTRKYIDECIEAVAGREVALGALNIELKKYQVKGLFSPLRRALEWFAERSLVNQTFKLEGRLEKLEKTKAADTAQAVHRMVGFEKEFVQDFERVLKDMSLFTLMLIRTAHSASDEIANATSEQRYDLPQSMRVYETGLINVLNQEDSLLKSLNKSREQLTNLAKDTKLAIHKLIKRTEEERAKTKTGKVFG